MAAGKKKECPMCGHTMIDIRACHDLCLNCGAQLGLLRRPVEDPRACRSALGQCHAWTRHGERGGILVLHVGKIQ